MDEYRPRITAIVAMSADGKISDAHRTAARFPSTVDQQHLKRHLATADATLFGASTLRSYGTTALITDPMLLEQRRQNQQPPQPTHIVCSQSGQIDAAITFFSQPISRWLLTTATGAEYWPGDHEFERVWVAPTDRDGFAWATIMADLKTAGIKHLVVMGGGQLVASLMAADLIDELWLTICPLIIGGHTAPTPCDGPGFAIKNAPALTLISAQTIGDEVFLNYQRQR